MRSEKLRRLINLLEEALDIFEHYHKTQLSILWREKTNDLLAEVYAEVEEDNEKKLRKRDDLPKGCRECEYLRGSPGWWHCRHPNTTHAYNDEGLICLAYVIMGDKKQEWCPKKEINYEMSNM